MTDVERELLALVIGHRIRMARVEQNLSQGELAAGIGSQSMISLLESGRQLPYPEVLRLIAQRLQNEPLQQLADLLDNGQLTWDTVSVTNEDLLLDILLAHRGRWYDIHYRLAIRLCEYFYMREDTKTVQNLCQLLVEHTEEGDAFYCLACFYLGSSALLEMDLSQAEQWLRRAEEQAHTLDEGLRGRLWYNLGYLYTTTDVQGVAAWHANQAVEQFRRLQDFPRYARSLALLGAIQGRIGRIEDAKRTLQLAHEIVVKWGTDYRDRARVEASLTIIYYLSDDLDAATRMIEQAAESAREAGDTIAQTIVGQVTFMLFTRLHRRGEAEQALEQFLSGAYQSGDSPLIAYSELLSIGYLPARQDQLDAALRAFRLTLNSVSHIEHALAAECAASIYDDLGEEKKAKHYYLAALSSYRAYVDKNSMFSHLIRMLPIGGEHES
ncbi:helix-turn-helix domain-containing protein [Alicyclobacillus ferrooxydans]|uniref:HTH cro/C1-type domain-containing protein n=1 Tax=Alicyclobacillus ferrooxydans TaxID=471514 RepID=A0A0P9EX93_9BACL|nr:helix-turn-helix transcriptional regulator [Alicyclobacillus ferrooxydans]KPV43756.1 hypothetical protein AN477_10195 [Alicyclobacillus ferrooxydans]